MEFLPALVLALWLSFLAATCVGLVQGNAAAKHLVRMKAKWLAALVYLARARDRAWSLREVQDAAEVDLKDPALRTKTVVFIRHGESAWNEMFNRGFGLGFPVRVALGYVAEVYRMTFGDSVFIDSPLSTTGEKQAEDLRAFLESQSAPGGAKMFLSPSALAKSVSIAKQVHAGGDGSVIVSSNLRRAMATAAIALKARIVNDNEKVFVLSSLQEMSRNVDTISLSSPRSVQACLGGSLVDVDTMQIFEPRMNYGNKKSSMKSLERIQVFAQWLLEQEQPKFIVCGHSLYFRTFFQVYLPKQLDHVCKRRKIANAGVVAFELAQDSKGRCCVLPQTITPVYLGFAK